MDGTCFCGATAGVRLYAAGPRCPSHTPARLAGKPEPDTAAYCAPLRCYCAGYRSALLNTQHQGETR